MGFAMVAGTILGLIAAILMGSSFANAFADCELNRRSLETLCEPDAGIGLFVGAVTFATVMLQAFIIGTILQTSALVKAMARGMLPVDQNARPDVHDDAEDPQNEYENADLVQLVPSESKADESTGSLGRTILLIIIIGFSIPVGIAIIAVIARFT